MAAANAMAKRRVMVTGMGVVSPFGVGKKVYWDGLSAGRSGVRLITSFDASQLPTRFAATVPETDAELEAYVANQKALKTMSRSARFAVVAAAEAAGEAGLQPDTYDPIRLGTSLGAGGLGMMDLSFLIPAGRLIREAASTGNRGDAGKFWRELYEGINPVSTLQWLPNIPTSHIAINHNARGVSLTVATACTSSAQAIGEAYRLIKNGVVDAMIAGGADSIINPYGLIAFSGLGVISRNNEEFETAARPFDRRRDGFVLGEGAAVFILEDWEHCRRRSVTPYCEIIGYGSASDAYRLTDEPPDAHGSISAMRMAVDDAALSVDRIDYINAHGTGTPMNDRTETFAIKSLLGSHARSVPVSSTKSMVGHLVAAAGAIEAAATFLALRHQAIPPTINYLEPDPDCDLDYVPNVMRPAPIGIALSNSFGFGGQNACLIAAKF